MHLWEYLTPPLSCLKKNKNKTQLDRWQGLGVKFVGTKQDKEKLDWYPGQQDQPVTGDTQ